MRPELYHTAKGFRPGGHWPNERRMQDRWIVKTVAALILYLAGVFSGYLWLMQQTAPPGGAF